MTVCVCVSLWKTLQEPPRPELPLYTLSPGRGGGRGQRGARGTTHSSPAWGAEEWVTLQSWERQKRRDGGLVACCAAWAFFFCFFFCLPFFSFLPFWGWTRLGFYGNSLQLYLFFRTCWDTFFVKSLLFFFFSSQHHCIVFILCTPRHIRKCT